MDVDFDQELFLFCVLMESNLLNTFIKSVFGNGRNDLLSFFETHWHSHCSMNKAMIKLKEGKERKR